MSPAFFLAEAARHFGFDMLHIEGNAEKKIIGNITFEIYQGNKGIIADA